MCTVVNLAAQAIDRDYVEPLRRRLQRGYDPRDATGAFLVAANNLDLAAEYTARLRQEVAEAWHAQAAIEADAATTAAQQLEAATTQLAETQEAVQASADGAMATLFDRAWRSELRQALQDIYRDAKYVLTEDEYDAWRTSADTQGAAAVLADVDRTGRTFKVAFLRMKWCSMLASTRSPWSTRHDAGRPPFFLQPLLTASNYGRLMQHVAQLVASEVEKVVLRSRFNAVRPCRERRGGCATVVAHMHSCGCSTDAESSWVRSSSTRTFVPWSASSAARVAGRRATSLCG